MRSIPGIVALLACAAPASLLAAEPRVDFGRQILPLLANRCLGCHSGAETESGVRLDRRADLLGETNGKPVVDLQNVEQSRLLRAVRQRDAAKRMPQDDDPLSGAEIKLLRDWIAEGLAWDDSLLPAEDGADHWAFQSVHRPPVPARTDGWIQTPVDAFLAKRLAEAGIAPNPPAAPRILVRRLALDLLGLPPEWDEIRRFEADSSDGAWSRLVDEYLASPHYGERWGRHWLDVARWSESEGFESNHPRAYAWRYRDYVVESFNRDRPFDEFITQQIAGDELPEYSDANLIATGFLAAARISSNEEDKWLQRNDVNVDVVNAVSSALLGLTMNCAQCHNHKYDPISARDFYGLQAFFVRGQPVDAALRDERLRREFEAKIPEDYLPAWELKQALFRKGQRRLIEQKKGDLSAEEWAAWNKPIAERSPEEERIARIADLKFQTSFRKIYNYLDDDDRELYEKLSKRLEKIEKTIPDIPQTYAWYSPVTSPHDIKVLPALGFYPIPLDEDYYRNMQTYLMVGGDVHRIGPAVEPGVPTVLAGSAPLESKNKTPTRIDLARWLTDPRNPLVARVWVNRIWQYHFGRGLVETSADFGLNGSPPSHPQLLDWLASELIDSGWSTKHIHRLILNSYAYRESTGLNTKSAAADPENRLRWRFDPRRLEAEIIRDDVLAVTGRLDDSVGGKSVPEDERESSTRRSLYLFQRRGKPTEMLQLFDGPNEVPESCSLRYVSTSPLQSLYLLNDKFTLDCARSLAKEIESAEATGEERVVLAFRRILQRNPTAEELARVREFQDELSGAPQQEAESPLTLLCQLLLNTSEFVYLE